MCSEKLYARPWHCTRPRQGSSATLGTPSRLSYLLVYRFCTQHDNFRTVLPQCSCSARRASTSTRCISCQTTHGVQNVEALVDALRRLETSRPAGCAARLPAYRSQVAAVQNSLTVADVPSYVEPVVADAVGSPHGGAAAAARQAELVRSLRSGAPRATARAPAGGGDGGAAQCALAIVHVPHTLSCRVIYPISVPALRPRCCVRLRH
jgi:hypothetical protein